MQVLNEFVVVAYRKLGMTWTAISNVLVTVRTLCRVEPLVVPTHERAIAIASRYGISFYDANIVAASLLAGCRTLYSEDLQHGQTFDRQLVVVNPFRDVLLTR